MSKEVISIRYPRSKWKDFITEVKKRREITEAVLDRFIDNYMKEK